MAKLTYNLDEISTAAVLPGKYKARLVKCEQTLSSQKNPMLVWTWKILDGTEKDKEIRSFTSLLPNALSGLKAHLEAFGLTGEVDLDTALLIGRNVVIVVIAREGETREGIPATFSNVGAVLPSDGPAMALTRAPLPTEEEEVAVPASKPAKSAATQRPLPF